MKLGILQRYIYKEIFLTLSLILTILTLIFFLVVTMQFVQRYSEYISFLDFIALAPYLMIKIVVFTMPLGMLAATTIFYGRMANDREILILRAAGIHSRNIFRPAFIIGFVLAICSLYINHELVPYSFFKQQEIRYKALETILRANFSSKGTTIDYIPNVRISYRELKDGQFRNLVIQSLEQEQVVSEILAESGILVFEKQQKILTFCLNNGTFCNIPLSNSSKKVREERVFFKELNFPIPIARSPQEETNYGRAKNKRYKELLRDIEIWQKRMISCQNTLIKFQELEEGKKVSKKVFDAEKKEFEHAKEKYFTHLLVWHNRTAISLAPWIVVFLGVSLGLLVQHSNRLVAFAVSALPVILIYYPIQMFGQYMAENSYIPIWLGGWLGTLVTGSLGISLLFYVYRR